MIVKPQVDSYSGDWSPQSIIECSQIDYNTHKDRWKMCSLASRPKYDSYTVQLNDKL